MPKPTFSPAEIMLRADELFRAEKSLDLRSLYSVCFALSVSNENGNHSGAGHLQAHDSAIGTARKDFACDRVFTWNRVLPPEDHWARGAGFFPALCLRTYIVTGRP